MFTTLFNLAMRLEREQFLNAASYERSSERLRYASGTKPKKVDTKVGTITLDIPKTRETEQPFYPQSLERGPARAAPCRLPLPRCIFGVFQPVMSRKSWGIFVCPIAYRLLKEALFLLPYRLSAT